MTLRLEGAKAAFAMEEPDYPPSGSIAWGYELSHGDCGGWRYLRFSSLSGEAEWTGRFEVGTYKGAITAAFAVAEATAIVVLGGLGYVVPVRAPSGWRPLRLWPIVRAKVFRDPELIALASFTGMAVCAPGDVLWTVDGISDDGVEPGEAKGGILEVAVWSGSKGAERLGLEISTGHECLLEAS